MLSKEQVTECENAMLNAFEKAQTSLGRFFDCPNLIFKMGMGGTAGRACLTSNRIELNLDLCVRNFADFLIRTIPHEVAHFVVEKCYPYAKQFHGPEFRHVCRILGVSEARCHNYDITGVSGTRQRRKVERIKTEFSCGCGIRTVMFTPIKLKRLDRGINYICIQCKQRITKISTIKA